MKLYIETVCKSEWVEIQAASYLEAVQALSKRWGSELLTVYDETGRVVFAQQKYHE